MIDPSKFLSQKLQAVILAGQEAAPAIFGGLFGQDRKDTSMSPQMEQGVKDAYRTARERGSKVVDYKDYARDAGGMSARLTTGKMGFNEFKTDDQGNVTGFTQTYDTNKTPGEALSEFNILKPNTYYKPFEAALAQSQRGGVTTHDITFNNPIRPEGGAAPEQMQQVPDVKASPYYTVKSGDTLTGIASQTGVSMQELMRKNALQDANIISVGQQLKY